MFALFFKDTMELVTSVERESQAMLAGKALSRVHGREVVAYHNGMDGCTRLYCSFENGECIFEKPVLTSVSIDSLSYGNDKLRASDETALSESAPPAKKKYLAV